MFSIRFLECLNALWLALMSKIISKRWVKRCIRFLGQRNESTVVRTRARWADHFG